MTKKFSAFLIPEGKYTWQTTDETARPTFGVYDCRSVKSHLLCLQKVLHAGRPIHMLTGCTCPAQSRESQFLCVSSSLQSCALLFTPSCAAELLNICFLTLLLLNTCALAHNHKCRYRLKGHGLPPSGILVPWRMVYSFRWPLGSVWESSFSIWWQFMCVHVYLVSLRRGKGACKGKWRESGCSGFIGVGHELRLGYMVRWDYSL